MDSNKGPSNLYLDFLLWSKIWMSRIENKVNNPTLQKAHRDETQRRNSKQLNKMSTEVGIESEYNQYRTINICETFGRGMLSHCCLMLDSNCSTVVDLLLHAFWFVMHPVFLVSKRCELKEGQFKTWTPKCCGWKSMVLSLWKYARISLKTG